MTNYAINRKWYEEIKNEVKTANAYFYTDSIFGEMVEIDVNEDDFLRVSYEKGWL